MKKKNVLKEFVKKGLKKLLTPIVREVIKEREDELIEAIRRVGFH